MNPSKPIIYLIDDHKSFTIATKHIVNHYHNSFCEVFAFSDAELALETLLANPSKPDYVFLDLSMPKIDGWSFIDRLKTDLKTDRFPFELIILTGSESKADFDEAMENTAVKYFIRKPLDAEKIRQVFESERFIHQFKKG